MQIVLQYYSLIHTCESGFASKSVRHCLFTAHIWTAHLSTEQCPQAAEGGFPQSKTDPFHLKAVTKLVLHRTVESNWVGCLAQSVQSPKEAKHSAAQPPETKHAILSGFSERKLSKKGTGKKIVKRFLKSGSGLPLPWACYPRAPLCMAVFVSIFAYHAKKEDQLFY